MSIERELREIKAEVEKLERVANSKVELEDLPDKKQNAVEYWEHAFNGKVVSINDDGGIYDVYIRVRDTELDRNLLSQLVKGPGFWSIDVRGNLIVVNF